MAEKLIKFKSPEWEKKVVAILACGQPDINWEGIEKILRAAGYSLGNEGQIPEQWKSALEGLGDLVAGGGSDDEV